MNVTYHFHAELRHLSELLVASEDRLGGSLVDALLGAVATLEHQVGLGTGS